MFATRLFAADPAVENKRKNLFLYDHEKKDGIQWNKPLIPDRVYLRFEPELGKWLMVVTDIHGRLPKPMQYLHSGTVLRGSQVGAKNDPSRFKLADSGTWEPTDEREVFIVWVQGLAPQRQMVSWRPHHAEQSTPAR